MSKHIFQEKAFNIHFAKHWQYSNCGLTLFKSKDTWNVKNVDCKIREIKTLERSFEFITFLLTVKDEAPLALQKDWCF